MLSIFPFFMSPCISLEKQVLIALKQGYLAYARFLIEQNPRLLAEPLSGYSPLTHAVLNNQVGFVSWCIERNALLGGSHKVGALNPLSAAICNSHTEIVHMLLKAGMSATEQFIDGHYPLHYAALYCPAVVEVLLQHGAKPNVLNYQEDTPLALHLSTAAKYDAHGKKALELLLLAGADPHVVASSTAQCVRLYLVDDLGIVPEAQELLEIFDLGCSAKGWLRKTTLKGLAVAALAQQGNVSSADIALFVAKRTGDSDFPLILEKSVSPELFARKYLKDFSKLGKPSAFQTQ